MKCLIIAAGEGKRISKIGRPKPLVNLLGLTLIERVILTANKSGITDFYVVTGYQGEKVRKFLDKFSQKRNINITHIINEEWKKGNGLSVLKAKGFLNEKFILLMGDHLFDEDILKKMKTAPLGNGEVMLAVDYNINSNHLVDIEDVTKVLVQDGKVIDIGKDIKEYNAYDTGIFLCSPTIFEAIEKNIHQTNEGILSASIKLMAKEGRVKTFDIKNCLLDRCR
ncbi:Bifunctional IPC transferase and DIPP synthase [Candidatus Methanoperedenaceae archaeon GB50]|nr:Bifunctional IPC transferase and DIPP synthase [Candidatus Methanoperedenaceae archaeon GB50]